MFRWVVHRRCGGDSGGGYQLVLHVIGGEKVLQSGCCLVVKCLAFWFETLGSEFLVDVIICLDLF
jgi:hypothetical protein